MTIKTVPSAGMIKIVETPDNFYTATHTDSAGGGGANDTGAKTVGTTDRTFAFANKQAEVPATGADAGDTGAMLLLSTLALLMGLCCLAARVTYRRKKQEAH